MHDGTWKGLPLSYGWKVALKACDRESECGDVATGRVAHALARDLRNELSPAFVRRLMTCAADFFPGFDTVERLAPKTVLECSVADRFSSLERSAANRGNLVQLAVQAAAYEWLRRQERHVRQYCIRKEGAAAASALRAFAVAVAAVDVAAIIQGRLADERLPRAVPQRPIDMNEDLTRPQ